MAIEIVDFPIKNGWFSIVMLVYQRVFIIMKWTAPDSPDFTMLTVDIGIQ